MKALFVTHHRHIGSSKGGVQVCTEEYIEALTKIGFSVEIVEIENDQRLTTKLIRRLRTSPYFRPIDQTGITRIVSLAQNKTIVFLNQVALAGALAEIKRQMVDLPPVVLLSHGCEITDLLHLARMTPRLPLSGRIRPTKQLAMSNVLHDEVSSRNLVDGVIALSEYDMQTELWLGAPRATWFPRTVNPAPLDWKPKPHHFGYVGTLDHGPNLDGLVKVVDEIVAQKNNRLRIRIIGSPPHLGKWLTDRYTCVDYLGPLNDEELRIEAAQWMGFINPIFCQARGCSTKLALGLSWQIPIITTTIGRRGYLWDEGGVIEANSAGDFVSSMARLYQERGMVIEAQKQVVKASESIAGKTNANTARLGGFLKTLQCRPAFQLP